MPQYFIIHELILNIRIDINVRVDIKSIKHFTFFPVQYKKGIKMYNVIAEYVRTLKTALHKENFV